MFKDNFYELVKLIVNIINFSIIEGYFLLVWKRVYVMLVFKIFKVVDFGKDFRLILVILLLVKIFESYFNGILLE